MAEEEQLCALSAAIQGRIDAVAANAAVALALLGELADAAIASDLAHERGRAIEDRKAELQLCISCAESAKVIALETELVRVDAALEKLQAGADDLRPAEVLGVFGLPPYEPVEPSTLFLVPASDPAGAEIAELCAPRAVAASDVDPGEPAYSWVRAGTPLRMSFVLSPARLASCSNAAERRHTSESLASRLRVVAHLVPRAPEPPSHVTHAYLIAGPAPAPSHKPIELPAICTVTDSGDGAIVSVAIPPDFVPAPGRAWAARMSRVELGNTSLIPELSPVVACPVVEHGPVCAPGALFSACRNSDVESVMRLLAGRPDSTSTEETDPSTTESCLVCAVRLGSTEIVEALLAAGANVRSRLGRASALHTAVKAHNARMVELLCRHPNVDVNATMDGNSNLTPLHCACAIAGVECARILLSDRRVDVNASDGRGRTALSISACRSEGILRQLLSRPDLNLNALDGCGASALYNAAFTGCLATVALLLADPRTTLGVGDRSAVLGAARGRQWRILIRLLADPRADVNARARDGKTVLHVAVCHECANGVRQVLADPRIDADARDENGDTALATAVAAGSREHVVRDMVSFPRLDPNAKNSRGMTPLHLAVYEGRDLIVRALLSSLRVNPNVGDGGGLAPLHLAASRGHELVMRSLLADSRVDVNARGSRGATALIRAASRGFAVIVGQICAHPDADVNAETVTGFTALHGAAYGGHVAVISLLLAVPGIEVNAANEDGVTPLLGAARYGRIAAVELLLQDARVDRSAKTRDGRGVEELVRASESPRGASSSWLAGLLDRLQVGGDASACASTRAHATASGTGSESA